jgi:hypothetical protein
MASQTSPRQQAKVRGTVIALTCEPLHAPDGAKPGSSLAPAARMPKVSKSQLWLLTSASAD